MRDQSYLIGVDEVGRGPIAGPVTVGVFCINVKNLKTVKRIFGGVKESKQLNENKREAWFRVIEESKKKGIVDFHVSFQSEKVIDQNGISFAIKKALADALKYLKKKPDQTRILLDGGLKAPEKYSNQKTIIKGDEKEMVIALASICAKVMRDRRMNKLSKKFPQYGFDRHKGYGTKEHYKAIKKWGMQGVHRKSYLKNSSTG